jgi:hypothetical protein
MSSLTALANAVNARIAAVVNVLAQAVIDTALVLVLVLISRQRCGTAT